VPQRSWSFFNSVIEAARVCAALFFLFPVFNDLSGDRLFQNLLIEWPWGRFVIIAVAYFLARTSFQNSLREIPLWKCLLWTFYGAAVIAIMVWAGFYGMHTEDANPYGVEQDLVGSRLFVDLLFPALLGTYLARREESQKPMPPWLARCVRSFDFGIGNALGIVNGVIVGAFCIGAVIVSGYVVWAIGSMIIERAEIGWYLLWAIPLLLFQGTLFLFFALLAFGPLSDWWDSRR